MNTVALPFSATDHLLPGKFTKERRPSVLAESVSNTPSKPFRLPQGFFPKLLQTRRIAKHPLDHSPSWPLHFLSADRGQVTPAAQSTPHILVQLGHPSQASFNRRVSLRDHPRSDSHAISAEIYSTQG